MGFIASVFTAIVDVIVAIVEMVVQVVEMVVQLIMVLLGWDGGSTQVIEYYEVQNIPLFDDVDKKNPTASTILQSILADKDLVSSLIYHLAFRSLKGNVKEFMDYIEYLEQELNVPITIVSVGPDRKQTLMRAKVMA